MTTYAVRDLEVVALGCDYDGPPVCWNEERRFPIRCELEAAYFHLDLGPESRLCIDNASLFEMFPRPLDAFSFILDTFLIVRRKDEAQYGHYRTKRVILEIYDQMTEIIEANEAIRAANPGKSGEELRPLLRSYQSPLNPPAGPPTDANGNYIPMSQWDPNNWPEHIHAPRLEPEA